MSTTRLTDTPDLREAYRSVTGRLKDTLARCGRKPDDVIMVAITGMASPDAVRTLVELGQRDFGETDPQQLAQRVVSLEEFLGRKRFLSRGDHAASQDKTPPKGAVRWHMVGPLPRNRVKNIAPLVKLVHGVDSLRLAEDLHEIGALHENRADYKPLDILLQVNPLSDPNHPGIAPPAVRHLADQIDTMVHLRLRGLHTTVTRGSDEQTTRHIYSRCREIFEDLRTVHDHNHNLNLLSMGSSDDFEIAVETGANIICVGRALFGER